MQETCPNLATCKWAQRRQTITVKCPNFGRWENCKPQDVVVEPADV